MQTCDDSVQADRYVRGAELIKDVRSSGKCTFGIPPMEVTSLVLLQFSLQWCWNHQNIIRCTTEGDRLFPCISSLYAKIPADQVHMHAIATASAWCVDSGVLAAG
jgi:hypothetical protein